MILGIGIDVVHVSRLKRWRSIPGLFERFFHPEELRAAMHRGEAGVLSLAARFAAKEALGKALGVGLRGMALQDISVMNSNSGKPVMYLYRTARKAFRNLGGKHIFVSLSHEKENALAVVVIEG